MTELYRNMLCIEGKFLGDLLQETDEILYRNIYKHFYQFFPQKITEEELYMFRHHKEIRRRIITVCNRILRLHKGPLHYFSEEFLEKIIIFLHRIGLYKFSREFASAFEDEEEKIEYQHRLIPERTVPTIRGLNYSNNSCYMDVILMAIFSIPNRIIFSEILEKNVDKLKLSYISCEKSVRKKIQKELCRIFLSIQGKEEVPNCMGLRKYLYYCNSSENFHGSKMQDPSEFLLTILMLFEVEIMRKKRVTWVTNDLEENPRALLRTHEEIQKCSPVHTIDVGFLKKTGEYSLCLESIEDSVFSSRENYYREPHTGARYKRRIEKTTIISADYLIWNISRIDQKSSREYFIGIPVRFTEKISLQNKSVKLHAIITYENMHYTCYLKFDKEWYYYDDAPKSTIKYVGTFSDLLKHEPSPETNGVLYFYSI